MPRRLVALLGAVLLALPGLTWAQVGGYGSSGYGSFGANGGGIVYYGNGSVSTTAPGTAEGMVNGGMMPPAWPTTNAYPGYASSAYPPCPMAGWALPNPPPNSQCRMPDGSIVDYPYAQTLYPSYSTYPGYTGPRYGRYTDPAYQRPGVYPNGTVVSVRPTPPAPPPSSAPRPPLTGRPTPPSTPAGPSRTPNSNPVHPSPLSRSPLGASSAR